MTERVALFFMSIFLIAGFSSCKEEDHGIQTEEKRPGSSVSGQKADVEKETKVVRIQEKEDPSVLGKEEVLSTGEGAEIWTTPDTLAKANANVRPGDTVILAPGDYTTPIAPARSGTSKAWIVYRSEKRHAARFTDVKTSGGEAGQTAVNLVDRAYVRIEGIAVFDVDRFIVGNRAHHVTIRDGHFENTKGFGAWESVRFRPFKNRKDLNLLTGGLTDPFRLAGDYIHLINNVFKNGTDMVSIQGGSFHLIEDNVFENANHACLAIFGVQRSVIRRNRFVNPSWRHMLVQSSQCSPERLTQHNVIEENYFGLTPNNAIQYSGCRSILRRNVFYKCMRGMCWTHYQGSAHNPEAWHTSGNRFYNNVVYMCGGNPENIQALIDREKAGVPMAEPRKRDKMKRGFGIMFGAKFIEYDDFYGNIHVNNIIFNNGTSLSEAEPTAQIGYGSSRLIWGGYGPVGQFFSNVIFANQPGQPVIFWAGAKQMKPSEPQNSTLREFEERYPRWGKGNLEVDPQFINPAEGNFHLRPDSPCIDAGKPLTHTTVSGKGRIVNVGDSSFFCDGFGIVEPDEVRIGTTRARVLRVDFVANTLTLDKTITWKANDPVSLDYKGTAPDIGVFEWDPSE